jgi:hypothetical protein
MFNVQCGARSDRGTLNIAHRKLNMLPFLRAVGGGPPTLQRPTGIGGARPAKKLTSKQPISTLNLSTFNFSSDTFHHENKTH